MLPASMMKNDSLLTGRAAVAIGIVVGLGTVLDSAAQSTSPAGATSRPALFTAGQATNGETVYRQSCASCHGLTLNGGSAPSLSGPRFAASWGDPRVTLDDLFFVLRTTMPPRESGALSAQDLAAVFAYILKAN